MRRQLWLALVLGVVAGADRASGASWMFLPGYYTHSPTTGERVNQYAPPAPAYARYGEEFLQSGYRHEHIQNGRDNTHIVETWGAGEWIRPYGEWQRPYRDGATPYGPWGNPQGPWTTPFDSWVNPYGLGKLPYGQGPYYQPSPYPNAAPRQQQPHGGALPPNPGAYGPQMQQPQAGPAPRMPYSGYGPAPPPSEQ